MAQKWAKMADFKLFLADFEAFSMKIDRNFQFLFRFENEISISFPLDFDQNRSISMKFGSNLIKMEPKFDFVFRPQNEVETGVIIRNDEQDMMINIWSSLHV